MHNVQIQFESKVIGKFLTVGATKLDPVPT